MELKWVNIKPTEPGAYWVRGYVLGRPECKALVEVTEHHGELFCNLHTVNSDNEGPDAADFLSDYSDSFEWCGPLVPTNGPQRRGNQQIYAAIKKSSKYAHQAQMCVDRGYGHPFKVTFTHDKDGYNVLGGVGGRYRLTDVNLYVIEDGQKIRIR